MAIKTSKSAEGYYARYKQTNKEASNRKAKLERQLRLQPGNQAQIELAIKNIHHRRKKPVAPFWSSSMIATAMLIKEFTGKFSKAAFSTDPLLSVPAMRSATSTEKPTVAAKGSMFSLAARAHNKGVLVWK